MSSVGAQVILLVLSSSGFLFNINLPVIVSYIAVPSMYMCKLLLVVFYVYMYIVVYRY